MLEVLGALGVSMSKPRARPGAQQDERFPVGLATDENMPAKPDC